MLDCSKFKVCWAMTEKAGERTRFAFLGQSAAGRRMNTGRTGTAV